MFNSLGNLTEKSKDFVLSLSWDTPLVIWKWIDRLFFDTTGLHVGEALKAILNIVVSVLDFILDILKWILSLFE